MECKLLKEELNIKGACLLTPKVFVDERGCFSELYNRKEYESCGIDDLFIQDNISISERGVLRGVHTQLLNPQAKIVACLCGRIFDVAVDCRPQSPTFRNWYGVELSGENHKQIYLPIGVAHGFYTIERATVFMKVTTHYMAGDEVGFLWNDSEVGIEWPQGIVPILAEKDTRWEGFNEMMKKIENTDNRLSI